MPLHLVLFLCLIISPVVALSVHAAPPEAYVLMKRVDERPDGEDRRSILVMELINRQGSKRVRRLLSLAKDYGADSRKVLALLDPPDVKGTTFLSWDYADPAREDDRWLYLPAMKRVRRIMGESRNDTFMGSDFTYDDLGDRSVDEDDHRLLGEETLEGIDCWVVESVPKDTTERYKRKKIWVRKDADLPIRVEYYDKDGLLKTLRVLEARLQDGFWVQVSTEMHNVQEDHRTVLTVEEIQHDTGLRDSLFEVATIQRGHLR